MATLRLMLLGPIYNIGSFPRDWVMDPTIYGPNNLGCYFSKQTSSVFLKIGIPHTELLGPLLLVLLVMTESLL